MTTRKLTDLEALHWLRQRGTIETTVVALAADWSWDRSTLTRRLRSWHASGLITCSPSTDGKRTRIVAVITPDPVVIKPEHSDDHDDQGDHDQAEQGVITPDHVLKKSEHDMIKPQNSADEQPVITLEQPVRQSEQTRLSRATMSTRDHPLLRSDQGRDHASDHRDQDERKGDQSMITRKSTGSNVVLFRSGNVLAQLLERRTEDITATLQKASAPEPEPDWAGLCMLARQGGETAEPEQEQPAPLQQEDDSRFAIHPKAATMFKASLGFGFAAALAAMGWYALDVTTQVNLWYAGSLTPSPETKAIFERGFRTIAYLSAFGPVALHVLRALVDEQVARWARVAVFIFLLFGLHAAAGFVAVNTDASGAERKTFIAQLDASDEAARRATATLDKVGGASWSQAEQEELTAKLKLTKAETACTWAKPAPTIIDACKRITDLRAARVAAEQAASAQKDLTTAHETRRKVEDEARAKGITLGELVNPISAAISEKVRSFTFGWIPLTPGGVDVGTFFLETAALELAVLVCFWLGGALAVGAVASLFRVQRRA